MYPMEHIWTMLMHKILQTHLYAHLSRIWKLTRFTRFIRKVFAAKILLSGKFLLFLTLPSIYHSCTADHSRYVKSLHFAIVHLCVFQQFSDNGNYVFMLWACFNRHMMCKHKNKRKEGQLENIMKENPSFNKISTLPFSALFWHWLLVQVETW